jgi:hypothetical protein
VRSQMHESLKFYKSVLEKIMRRDEARDFQRPVKDLWPAESIPGYFDVVKKPMDLGTVKKKLMSGQCARITHAASATSVALRHHLCTPRRRIGDVTQQQQQS